MIRIGTTGTQQGATPAQVAAARGLLSRLAPADIGVLHHGDCIGWDEQAHGIARTQGLTVEMHPPAIETKRAFCMMFPGEMRHPPLGYIERNHAIVDATSVLVACPKEEHFEELRSGTWSCVRYARRLKRPIYIVRPSGRVEREWMR